MSLRDTLVSAVTEYDRRQSTRRGYNPHALALYLSALDDVTAMVIAGHSVQYALERNFNGHLLTVLSRAAARAI